MNTEPVIEGRGAHVRPGDAAPTVVLAPLTLTDIVRYAGASGDLNPVHHDPGLARSRGNPDVFVMGMLPGSVLGALAVRWLAPLRITSLELRFVDRVWTHEVLECGGEVLRVEGVELREVRAKLWVRASNGDLKVTGECTASRATTA